MRLVVRVDEIVSSRAFGTIFRATAWQPGLPWHGSRLRIRAYGDALLGEPVVGEAWEIDGRRVDTPWGPQVEAARAVRVTPRGSLIVDYIAATVPGIGSQRAARLADHYGERLPTVIADGGRIGEVAEILAPGRPTLGPRLAALLFRTWTEAETETKLVEWLARQGFEEVALARRLARLLGPDAIMVLERNAYVLVPLLPWSRLDPLGLRLLGASGIAKPRADVRRLVGAVDAAVQATLRTGDTTLDEQTLRHAVSKRLGVGHGSPRISEAIAAGERNQAIIPVAGLWRAPGAALMEEAIGSRLEAMMSHIYPSPVQVPTFSELLDRLGQGRAGIEALHPEQARAVAMALQRPAACIQGGAGTGKTYTMRRLCDAWEELGGRVLLCALAGKAALRLGRTTGRLARTLARTLAELGRRESLEDRLREEDLDVEKLDSITFALRTLATVDERTLVVVDEASMVDVPTIHSLLRRMPMGARLLLVGDVAQLPPVGLGVIFHRMVPDPAVTLTLRVVHRQAAETGIPTVAASIREGRLPDLPPFSGIGSGVSFLERGEGAITAGVVEAVQMLGGHESGLLIVTPTKKGEASVSEINELFHHRHAEKTGRIALRGHLGRWFCEGEPVVQLRNDYKRGLFNGMLGKVVGTDIERRECTVLFDGENDPHSLDAGELLDLDLAYALTCHRAQGSSAPRVVVALARSQVLDPTWVYTAVTRAERQVVLVGSVSLLSEVLGRPRAADARRVGFRWPPR